MGFTRSDRKLGRVRLTGVVLVLLVLAIMPASSAIAASPEVGNDYFMNTWYRDDKPVIDGQAHRTWMWGPGPFTEMINETYANSPDGARQVQYFDKSRMEITHPNGDKSSQWYVTNGLLAEELVTGERQMGDNRFVKFPPAQENVAGDPNDTNGPTYATFDALLNYKPLPSGWVITQTVNRAGKVGTDASLRKQNVTAKNVGAPTHHTVASVFWDFMNSSGTIWQDYEFRQARLFSNPFYATGYPLTEPYWTTVKVGGVPKLVLVQVFERRVLTYTPSNPQGWKVEAGNVGRHYYQWRYVDHPDLGARGNPYPFGTDVKLGDGWDVTVTNVIPNATNQVLAENEFNDPPAAGDQFFIATVKATYHGSGSSNFDGIGRLRAVGASGVSYSTFDNDCGVVPNDISDPEVFNGGTITGNVCWEIKSSDASSLVMYDDPSEYPPPPIRPYMSLVK